MSSRNGALGRFAASGRASQTVAYTASVALLAVAALALIPAMVHSSGLVAWGSVATGQAIGVLGATVVNFGWPITGPAIIAATPQEMRRLEVIGSLKARAALMLCVAPACVVTALAVSPAHMLEAWGGVGLGLALGLGVTWFFIGVQQPWALFAWDTLPRVLASGVAVVLLYAGVVSAWGGALVAAGGILFGALLSHAIILRGLPTSDAGRGTTIRSLLKSRRHGVAVAMSGSVANAAPILLVSAIAPSQVGLFALVERPVRQLLSGMSIAINQVQGELADTASAAYLKKVKFAVALAATSVIPLALLLSLAGWVLIAWLSSGVPVPSWAPVMVGAITALAFVELMFSRAILPPLRAMKPLATLTNWSLGATVVFVLAGAVLSGAFGSLVGLGLATALRVLVEILVSVKYIKRWRAEQ